jgi:hypothetical protein
MIASPKFDRLAKTITRNARSYRSKWACEMQIRRLKAAYVRSGSYGFEHWKLKEAIAACQDRCLEIIGNELDAKYGT